MTRITQDQAKSILAHYSDLQTIGAFLGPGGAGGFGGDAEKVNIELGDYFMAVSRGELDGLTTEKIVELFARAVKASTSMFRSSVEPKVFLVAEGLGLADAVKAALEPT